MSFKTNIVNKTIVVAGGNGFVGKHVCAEAISRGYNVISLSRSGEPKFLPNNLKEKLNKVNWVRADLSNPQSFTPYLNNNCSVISCVGAFGNINTMVKANGLNNQNLILQAKQQGVNRFVYISAHEYSLPSFLYRGYYEGKLMTEEELLNNFNKNGKIVKPGPINGTRYYNHYPIPLWIIMSPWCWVLRKLNLNKWNFFSFSKEKKFGLSDCSNDSQLSTLNIFIQKVLSLILISPVRVETVAKLTVDLAQMNSPELLAQKNLRDKNFYSVEDLLTYQHVTRQN